MMDRMTDKRLAKIEACQLSYAVGDVEMELLQALKAERTCVNACESDITQYREIDQQNQTRIAELEADRKTDCVNFFRWFWNQPGTNAEQGYDEWLKALQQENDDE